MRQKLFLFFLFAAFVCSLQRGHAQVSSSSNLVTLPKADREVPFDLSQQGVTHDVQWGGDLAWMHEQNFRRCVLFMGYDNMEIARCSFQPTYPVGSGDLQTAQKKDLNYRLSLLKYAKPDVKLTLNCDHPTVDEWYTDNPTGWADLIEITTKYFQEAGYEVITVAPFNEPDYGWGQGDINDFKAVAAELKKRPFFDHIRISGGNTLNCNEALPWFNTLKEYLDEGNTHQLAGDFDQFANFFTQVRKAGKHATADEMHNVMEAMVGLEYGLQTGIWWGPAEYARGEFCKASHGERLGYAEHRPNWTAASVYRAPDGKVQAFGGTSERQAATTTYRFFSKDRDVYFNGYGPTREYIMELPGGTGYQSGQSNAEGIVNITWGDDIQPIIDGTYAVYNKNTKQLLTYEGGLGMSSYSKGKSGQHWEVLPTDLRIGGDFSYYYLTPIANPNTTLDVLNFSLEDAAEVVMYGKSANVNQQWYLEYAGDGWFYIRNRHSSYCLEVGSNNNLQQGIYEENKASQLWRFLPINKRPRIRKASTIDCVTVTATATSSSVLLTWNPSGTDTDTYSVLRAETSGGPYNLIARDVTDTAFVDNKTEDGQTYHYVVKVVDEVLNSSLYSEEVTATPTSAKDLVTHYEFEENINDTTCHLLHGVSLTPANFVEGHSSKAISMNGSTDYVQLPTHVGHHDKMTVATWIQLKNGDQWPRVFDFGNGTESYMFLTTKSDQNKFRFAIKAEGTDEQSIDGVSLTTYRSKWAHIAVTMDEEEVCLYLNGEKVASTTEITLRPSDVKGSLNYLGRSQFANDPLYKGYLDDFRIYNYALDEAEMKALAEGTETAIHNIPTEDALHITMGQGHVDATYAPDETTGMVRYLLYDMKGGIVSTRFGWNGCPVSIPTSDLPKGVYILKASCGPAHETKKLSL